MEEKLPQIFCGTGRCDNYSFLNTVDPYTIEYDNMVSGFHNTIAKQTGGNYLIWGQGADPTHPDGNGNFTEPVLIIRMNEYRLGKITIAGRKGWTGNGSNPSCGQR